MTELYISSKISQPDIWTEVLNNNGLSIDTKVSMLPYAGKIGLETRKLYFNLAVRDGRMSQGTLQINDKFSLSKQLPVNRIISYGECNVACPYCKRDCQFIDGAGNVLGTATITITELLKLCVAAIDRGETPRFSGGDPVSFKKETQAIAEYIFRVYGEQCSIAHNGTWGASIKKLMPYLKHAAIDLKAPPAFLGKVMGVKASAGESLFNQSLKTQKTLTNGGVLVDIRTPVFGTTTVSDMSLLARAITATNNLNYVFWTWRLYKTVEGCVFEVPEKDVVIKMMLQVSLLHPTLWMGMRAKWQEGGMLYIRNGEVIDMSDGGTVELTGSGNRLLC